MWGLFVGMAIGVLQVLALSILGKMILGDNVSAKLIGGLLLIVKIAAIVLILFLVASVSLTHLIWAAVGMLAGLIAALVFLQIRRSKKEGKDSNTHARKDNSDV